jgi:hypothetical protein
MSYLGGSNPPREKKNTKFKKKGLKLKKEFKKLKRKILKVKNWCRVSFVAIFFLLGLLGVTYLQPNVYKNNI